ncbi:MAG: hypothetical protein AAF085_04895 [Planctomycetota bacterium]
MTKQLKQWTGLLVLCLVLTGCGGEEQPVEHQADQEVTQAEVEPKAGEVMIEITGWEYKPEYKNQLPSKPPMGQFVELAVFVVEEQFGDTVDVTVAPAVHSGRYQIVVDPPEQADAFFQATKEFLDSEAKKEVAVHLDELKSDVELYAEVVAGTRQQLRELQERYRGQPKDSDTQLLFRKLDKSIRESLEDQIAAEERVKTVEKQIERGRYMSIHLVE